MPATPLNQFLLRQLDAWLDQPLNLIAAPSTCNLSTLANSLSNSKQQLQVWSNDWRCWHQAQNLALTNSYLDSFFTAHSISPPQLAGRSLLFWPKAKEEGYWWLQQLLGYNCQQLYLIGANNAGVNAAAKQLAKAGANVSKIDSARRCSLYQVNQLDLAQSFITSACHTRNWQGPNNLQLISQPSVFSHGQLDAGSELLLATLAEQLTLTSGQLLDLGCGCGLLGAWLVHKHPQLKLTATDINGLALQATQATLAANQLHGLVQGADIFTGLTRPAEGFNLIVSNPPFHTGTATDYELAQRLISQAPSYLQPKGELWLVANSFLPYPDLLQQAFGSYTLAADNGKFRVYKAVKNHN